MTDQFTAFFDFAELNITDVFAPMAILLSASVAMGIATWQIRTQRRLAKERITWDTMFHRFTDREALEARQRFDELIYHQDFLEEVQINDGETEGDSWVIIEYLNQYELLCQGIRRGVLDEDMAKGFLRGRLVRDYRKCSGYFVKWRKEFDYNDLYCDFEYIGKRWFKYLRAKGLMR